MNTNTIRVLSTTVATALIAGLGGLEVTGNVLTGATVGLSYLVVAALVVIAASDYRTGPKAYFVAPVVTTHFKRAVPASAALRTPRAKARVAA